MKKTKILLSSLLITSPLLTLVPILTSCGNDKEEKQQVKNIKVEGEIKPQKDAVVTYTIDSNYTLDVKESTIQFADTNAEKFSLAECIVDTANHKITIPACRVTSTKPTFNFVSMKINTAITKDQVIQELQKTIFAYQGKNESVVFTVTNPNGGYITEINKLKDMDQYFYGEILNEVGKDPTITETQTLYNQDLKGWIKFDKDKKEVTFNNNQVFNGSFFYVFSLFDWSKITKMPSTNGWTAKYIMDETTTIDVVLYLDKNNKLDHGEYVAKTEEGLTQKINILFDTKNSAQFDKWDMPDISNCSNYISSDKFTDKQNAKVMHTVQDSAILVDSYCLAVSIDLSKYTTFTPSETLKLKYKPNYSISDSYKVTIKVNNDFLKEEDYQYDKATGLLTIKANKLTSNDKLFISIGTYDYPFGARGSDKSTLVISQDSSFEVKTAYFFENARQFKTAIVVVESTEPLTALVGIPVPSGYDNWAYEKEVEGEKQWIVVDQTTTLTEDLKLYPHKNQ